MQKDLLRVTGILQINRNQIVKQGPSSPQVIHAQYAHEISWKNVTKNRYENDNTLLLCRKIRNKYLFPKKLDFSA